MNLAKLCNVEVLEILGVQSFEDFLETDFCHLASLVASKPWSMLWKVMCFLKDIHLFISFVYFQIEQYLSLSKDIKITITPNEMYRIHELILKHKEELVRKLKFHHYQYVRPNDKLPSVKHPFLRAKRKMCGLKIHLLPWYWLAAEMSNNFAQPMRLSYLSARK